MTALSVIFRQTLVHQTRFSSSILASQFHTTSSRESRSKWNFTHNPFYLTKKTAKNADEPLTSANRAFLNEVLKDSYNNEDYGERYAYVSPDEGTESPLKGHLQPWSRGKFDDDPRTTRVGLLGRKIGVVPMWRSDGSPIMATMLHVRCVKNDLSFTHYRFIT